MFPNVEDDSIVKVDVIGENDVYKYGNIEFSSIFSWTESDKELVEGVVTDFYNSFDRSGQKVVSASFGEVVITHEQHPSAPRMKLILGFVKDPVSTSMKHNFLVAGMKISFLLKGLIPSFIEKNTDAILCVNDLDREVQLDESKIEKLKFSIFTSILESLEKEPKSYTSSEASSQRLSHFVANVKTFLPNQKED